MENNKKKINDSRLSRILGGSYTGGSECPACHQHTMALLPSILDSDGNSYSGYRCTACGHEEYVRK